jgi:hypothetical protein
MAATAVIPITFVLTDTTLPLLSTPAQLGVERLFQICAPATIEILEPGPTAAVGVTVKMMLDGVSPVFSDDGSAEKAAIFVAIV